MTGPGFYMYMYIVVFLPIISGGPKKMTPKEFAKIKCKLWS
jgi:hypothetical protein